MDFWYWKWFSKVYDHLKSHQKDTQNLFPAQGKAPKKMARPVPVMYGSYLSNFAIKNVLFTGSLITLDYAREDQKS